jgi:hypothetical protein
MTQAANVRVEAVPNFISNLETARLFFVEQDADTASERFRKLKAELREMVTVLSWSPASGHPARFFSGRSAQTRLRAQTVQQLSAQAGLPHLREYLVSRHIVLYAHSEVDVVLLALKHQRHLAYSAEG